MQKIKVLMQAFAVVAIASSALAFKERNYFTNGTVYCNSSCTSQVAFKVDPVNGSTSVHPCGLGNTEYLISSCGGSIVCNAIPAGTKFKATTDQGN